MYSNARFRFLNQKLNFPTNFSIRDLSKSCVRPSENISETTFDEMLPSWLVDNPDEYCSKGGHAAYGSGSVKNFTIVCIEVFYTFKKPYHSMMKTK